MDKRNLAFGRMNFILLAIGMAIVVIGFILMSGAGSSDTTFDPDIFSARRIKVAPVVCLFGFVSMIYAVMYRGKDDYATTGGDSQPKETEDNETTSTIKTIDNELV